MNEPNQTAYLAPRGFESLLINELKDVEHVFGRLIVAKGPAQRAYWVQNIWYNPRFLPAKSIGSAASALKNIQRNWWPYEFQLHRRMELIKEKLPHISAKALNFLDAVPASPLGSWTLVDEETLLAASHCSSPRPNGEWFFNEDKINPPSRAYLKLWEFFTRFGVYPKKSELCLDLGASPGGWTFVLAHLARKVIAHDKSPLDARILALPNVSYRAQDAFKIKLGDYTEIDWIFSDVICYPAKLYDFICQLLKEYPDKKYVFTIKFQGSDNKEIISRFASLPGELVHLSNNKHELTWFKL